MPSHTSTKSIFSGCKESLSGLDKKWVQFVFTYSPIILVLTSCVIILRYYPWTNGLYSENNEIINFIYVTLSCNAIYLVMMSSIAYFFESKLIKVIKANELKEIIKIVVIKIGQTDPQFKRQDYDSTGFRDKSIEDYNEIIAYSDKTIRPSHRTIYAAELIIIFMSLLILQLDFILVNFFNHWKLVRFTFLLGLNLTLMLFLIAQFSISFLQFIIKNSFEKCINLEEIKKQLQRYIDDAKKAKSSDELASDIQQFKDKLK